MITQKKYKLHKIEIIKSFVQSSIFVARNLNGHSWVNQLIFYYTGSTAMVGREPESNSCLNIEGNAISLRLVFFYTQ